jgi:hypothetical protein
VDEVVIVRSAKVSVNSAVFRERVGSLAEELRRSGSVAKVSTYLGPHGEGLVSSDAHTTILPVVLAGDEEESVDDAV